LSSDEKTRRFRRLLDGARVIIFDFDGVLADSERYHFLAYRDVFRRYGHEVDETTYYKYWTSMGLGAKGEVERHGLDLDPVAIHDEKQPIFTEYCRDGSIRLFPEAEEIVRILAATDRVLTIASGSTRTDIEAILSNAGLEGTFRLIVGKDTVPTIKPAPDIFFAVLDALGAEPYECLVIEDAEKGMHAAVAADIPVVVVRTKETRDFDFGLANLVIDSHQELLELVRAAAR
jgi:HAD superfamily hydrolase (TIGR01509 family)